MGNQNFALCVVFAGEARSTLKWADGKVIKNEVDMQVGLEKRIGSVVIELLNLILYYETNVALVFKGSSPLGTQNRS